MKRSDGVRRRRSNSGDNPVDDELICDDCFRILLILLKK